MEKNKKNIILMLFILAILFVSASFADAKQTTQKPARYDDIAVNLISQLPDPAEPGNYVDVRFKFDNNGSGEAKNVEVEILPEYPFSLEKGAEKVKNIGTIQSMQRGDVGIIVKYKLRVDDNAIEGKNEIRIIYRIDNGVWVEPEEFFVDVQTHDAILSIDSVSIGKGIIEPGSSDNLRIRLSNMADSLLKDVEMKLILGGLPFIPLDSTDEKSIYKIEPKGTYEMNFKLLANPEAKSGAYQVPIEVGYSDNLGKKYFKNSTIGIIVGSKPEISISIDESDIYEKGKSGELIIKIVNMGVTNIKFATLTIMPSDEYKILSADQIYLGNIDSDDFETGDFKIYASNAKKEGINIPLTLEYVDANNNHYRENTNLTLKIYSSSEAKKFGLKAGNGFVGIFIIILIVAAGLFYYTRHKKRRDRPKNA